MVMADEQVPGASPAPARRRWLIRWLAATAVVVVGVGGFTAWNWYNTASDLISYFGIGVSAPVRVGQSFYVGSDIQPKSPGSGHRVMDLHRVTPRIAINTAKADVEVLYCRVSNPHLGMGTGFDTDPCATVTPFHPGSVDLGFPATEIIFKITCTQPGTVRIEGAQVTYFDGTRRGNQHAGIGSLITVSPGTR